jgi:glucosamine--fructose-6-phosphate aminotransferase (isomerizing)
MPGRIAEQLERSFEDASLLDSYSGIHGGTVVARGINYGTAFEVALKIRELSGLLFEAWSAADLMHGPVAAIAPDWPVIALAPSGPTLASMRTVIDGLVERGARVAVVADDPAVLAQGAVPLRLVEEIPEWLSPLATVIPGQVAAFRLAQLNGSDLDNPHGLSKVTLTL